MECSRQASVSLFDLSNFKDTGRVIELGCRHKLLAVSATGLLYVRKEVDSRSFLNSLQVRGPDGREIYNGKAFSDKWNAEILPLPNRPERVFVLKGSRLHVIDLGEISE